MYRLLLPLFLLSLPLASLRASRVSEADALASARAFLSLWSQGSNSLGVADPSLSAAPSLSLSLSSSGYYAFSLSSGGFVVVAGDDRAASPVLGYSFSGSLSPDSLPANLLWWLGEYDRQLAFADSAGLSSSSASPSSSTTLSAVSPLLSTAWNQTSPFNGLCPTIQGEQCPTGCVATALSQAMYYHQWPSSGYGSCSYRLAVGPLRLTLSADFSQSVYDWASMTPLYSSSSSEAAVAAVAKLMYDVGVASKTIYSPDGSGADPYDSYAALGVHFGYAKSILPRQRDYYTQAEWETMIHEELAQGRPVVYAGYTADGSSGHAFVVDGYADGYFHINWGWGGESDGYFLLSALDPYAQGVGGASSAFNTSQHALFGLAKDETGSTAALPLMYCQDGFGVAEASAAASSTAEFANTFVYYGVYPKTIRPGVKVVADDGSTTYIASSSYATFSPCTYISSFTIALSAFPTASGSYRVYPAYRDEDTGLWYDMRVSLASTHQYLLAEVSGSVITFSSPAETAAATAIAALTAQDPSGEAEVYSAAGLPLSATAAQKPGIYIVRQGGKTRKIAKN